MTADMAIVFTILGVSVVFLVTEWIPMEVTALLTGKSLAESRIGGIGKLREALHMNQYKFTGLNVLAIWREGRIYRANSCAICPCASMMGPWRHRQVSCPPSRIRRM